MRFKGLDLNLFVAFQVLLERQNVSRAAEDLRLSQSAVSAALARLRQYFDDPLLIADGKRMIPTAHAMRLKPLVAELLADAAGIVAVSSNFDPATAVRHFRIGTSDYIGTVAIAPLLRRLAIEAPNVTLEIIPPSDILMRQLEDGELDLMIVPSTMISDQHPAELLFEERHVIAGWARNPLLGRPMSQEEFIRAGHVVVEIGNVLRVSFAEAGLRRLGIQRRGEIIVTSFSIVPKLLIGTNRLAIMHERLACDAAKSLPISYTAPPFDLGIMSEMAQYHRARADDPSLRWLIETIRTSVPVIDEIG